MNRFLLIIFSLLQICLAQNSAIELFAAGTVKHASGAAAVKAVGDKVSGVAATDVKPYHVSSFAAASAESKKKPYPHWPYYPKPHYGKKGH